MLNVLDALISIVLVEIGKSTEIMVSLNWFLAIPTDLDINTNRLKITAREDFLYRF